MTVDSAPASRLSAPASRFSMSNSREQLFRLTQFARCAG
jgi:hypothetical protein